MARSPRAPETELRIATHDVDGIRVELSRWYAAKRRDLPWRRTRDPYRIWLSETMLQQTRVDTVIPYYERFTARFPDVRALADADEQDVLREWAGLGYYSRARNLQRAAAQVVRDHGGELPRDAESLAKLPGIGPYTVGALRSIAFGERAALVDGNVTRVLARWTAREEPRPAELWALAEALVPDENPGDFNQALMELGATVCTPRTPRCGECPVSARCQALRSGDPLRYPAPRKRPTPLAVEALGAVVENAAGELLLSRRPSRGLLGGMWEVPCIEGGDVESLRSDVSERTGLSLRHAGPVGEVRHLFTHRTLTLRLERFAPAPGHAVPSAWPDAEQLRWCGEAERDELPLSNLMRKVLARIARPVLLR